MRRPQWLPSRADLPGIALSTLLGGASLGLARALPPSPYVSDVLLAIVLGALVVNTPLRKLVGITLPGAEREADRYAPGLRYTGKWLLRAGIILMGLKVQTGFFGKGEIVLIFGTALAAIPTAFFAAHSLAVVLGVRRSLADLLAGGTMICGASAVNAIAPVAGAHRDEQGVAIAVVFLYSVVALLVFRPIAVALGLDPSFSGIWSGLAVNDLSSAIAVGAQMGGAGGVMAAAAKSSRILLLAPVLLGFSFLRRDRGPKKGVGSGIVEQLPMFVLGYVGLAVVRVVVDRTAPSSTTWAGVFVSNKFLVDLLLSTVSASIGLHLGVKSLLESGTRAVLVGGIASLAMAGVTLSMIWLVAHGASANAAWVGASSIVVSFFAYRMTASRERESRALRDRFESGAPLSLAEATRVLDVLEADRGLDDGHLRKLIEQLHPAIGELIPVRESPLPHGEGCRWVTYWEGKSGWALVAVCREPGSVTPVHAHSHRLIGKAIEGVIEEMRFDEKSDDEFRLRDRRVLAHDELCEVDGLSTLHVIRVIGDRTAIDLQLRGPEVGSPGRRLRVGALDVTSLHVGQEFPAHLEVDDRPGQGGEGASAGRPVVEA